MIEAITRILAPSFPPILIDCESIVCRHPSNVDRVRTELKVARVCGLKWTEVTAPQARGTYDILGYLSSPTLGILLPGYLKFLETPEEADVLITEIPFFLLGDDSLTRLLNDRQRKAIGEGFRFLMSTQKGLVDDDVLRTYTELARRFSTD